MNNGTTAPPGYVLPSRPRWQGGWNVRALLGAVVAFVMAASAASQWLAAQLNNPVEMGDPIVWFHGVAVFQPFAGLVLWKHCGQSPHQFRRAERDLDCVRRDDSGWTLSCLSCLLVPLPHTRSQEHR